MSRAFALEFIQLIESGIRRGGLRADPSPDSDPSHCAARVPVDLLSPAAEFPLAPGKLCTFEL
jgi:hypothetical protein